MRYILMIAALWAVFLCPIAYNVPAWATVTSGTNTITYEGDGTTTAFSFPYLFYDDTHLVVTVDGTTKTITTHYTVSGEGVSAGGTVTFLTAPADNTDVNIRRVVPYTQNTDFTNYDGYPAEVVEKALDLSAMMASQVGEYSDRTINVPSGTSLTTNDISGTIDATARLLTISTAGPATATVASLSESDLDVVLASETNGDVLVYNGSDWVNNNAIADLITGSPSHGEVPYINSSGDLATLSTSSAGAFLTTQSTGANPAYKEIEDFTDATVTSSDRFLFSDATDSGLHKSDTIQGILDLVSSEGAWTLLATASASASSSIDFTSASVTIDSTYHTYVLIGESLVPATDGASVYIRTSTDGGATFDTGASDYKWAVIYNNTGSSAPAGAVNATDTEIQIAPGGVSSGTGRHSNFIAYIRNPSNTSTHTVINGDAAYIDTSNNLVQSSFVGARASAADVDALRIIMSSGNITSGQFKLYGIQKQ